MGKLEVAARVAGPPMMLFAKGVISVKVQVSLTFASPPGVVPLRKVGGGSGVGSWQPIAAASLWIWFAYLEPGPHVSVGFAAA